MYWSLSLSVYQILLICISRKFFSLETVVHLSRMDLQGAKSGQLRMILLRCTQTTPLANHLLTCYSNRPKKISSAGLMGKPSVLCSIIVLVKRNRRFIHSQHYDSKSLMFDLLHFRQFDYPFVCNYTFCFSPFVSFEFRLRVSLASEGNLILISRIRNINGKPFSFSFAYHTHFSVSDIR